MLNCSFNRHNKANNFFINTSLKNPAFKSKDSLSLEEILEIGRQGNKGIKRAEEILDKDGNNKVIPFLEAIVNGDSGVIKQIRKALKVIESDLNANHDIEKFYDKEENKFKVKIHRGSIETTFENRTDIYSYKECSFEDFLAKPAVLGANNKKIIVSLTGWTKPPAIFLANSSNLTVAGLFKNKPEEKWQSIAEAYYVQLVKRHLSEVFNELKAEGCNIQDIVLQYGVTPQGIDRAVEEFCAENQIKCVGVTCFDWATFLNKENSDIVGKPPIYIAKNPKEFGLIMGGSDKIIIAGGRSFASTVTEDLKEVGKGKLIPVDLLNEFAQIKVPGIVLSQDDMMTAEILNASDTLLSNPKTNPANYPEVFSKLNTKNLRQSVFWTVQILKSALENLQLIKKISSDS